MKKIISVVTLLLLISINSMADVKKGQRLYKKNFYKTCGFSGIVFARHHLQEEWEDIYETGKFPEEAKIICPDLPIEIIKEEYLKDIFEYSVKYAKDGVPPNGCND
ncbi:hypothetical protein [Sulfurovum sp.]|uniref:hypothetical protein n=1 Tax=Sulfurovum sp. TaxID=1969726 RepID=UPI0035693966